MTASVLAEPAPDAARLALTITGPDGSSARWADDESSAERVPLDLQIATTLPGGDSEASCQLLRDMRQRLGDLAGFNEVSVYGPGPERRWRGYLVKSPDTAYTVTPAAIGDVGRLRDNPAVLLLGVDRDLGRWGSMSAARRISFGTGYAITDEPRTEPDAAGAAALALSFTGAWAAPNGALCEALYRSPVDLGAIHFGVKAGPGTALAPANWFAVMGYGTETNPFAEQTTLSATTPQTGSFPASAVGRRCAALQMYFSVAGGTEGTRYIHYWTYLAVFGRDVAPAIPAAGGPPGVLGPDLLRAAITKAAAPIGYDAETIAADPFIVPQATWLDPTTAEQIILDTNRYYRNLWAVYDRKLRWQPPETFGDRYTVRRDEGAEITSNGPDADADYNGVVVRYSDPLTNGTALVGPPASGLTGATALPTTTLVDTDPELELNRWGRRRWAIVDAGLTSEAGAIRIGELFLEGTRDIRVAGNITIGHRQARDTARARVQAWLPRAGDRLLIEDEANAAERLVVASRYNHDAGTNELTLDAPANGLEALLARLQVVLVGVAD